MSNDGASTPSAVRRDGARLATLAALAIALVFAAIHAQIFVFPNGFFGVLHADEIHDVVDTRNRIRAGEWLVLSPPTGHVNGGGVALGYLLAALPVASPHAITMAVRLIAIVLAGTTLLLWMRWWRGLLPTWQALVPGVLLLFPQQGWITNTIQTFGTYCAGAVAAALAVTLAPGPRSATTSGRAALLGAALAALALVAPAAFPTVAAVAATLAWLRWQSASAARLAAWLGALAAGALASAIALLALDARAAGPAVFERMLSLVWRPTAAPAGGSVLALAQRGFANLFHPERVRLMEWPLFYALLGLAVWGGIRGLATRRAENETAGERSDEEARVRYLAQIHTAGSLFTLAPHLLTRFADSAAWNVTPIVPHLVGLAGLALAHAWSMRGLARAGALGFVAIWTFSGVEAYEKRFHVEHPNLAYPAVAVHHAILPKLAEHPVTRVVSTYHWAWPLALERPDVAACCPPPTSCAVACTHDWLADAGTMFLLPGPRAHPHGEPEALEIAPRLVSAAAREGIPLHVEALRADGTWHSNDGMLPESSVVDSDAVAILATSPQAMRALATLLPAE